jgi:hypothetical protein
MANIDLENPYGIVDKRVGRGNAGQNILAEADNMDSVFALRNRLVGLNGTYFTPARLDAMTKNDMIYAVRLASADSAGI